MNTQQRNLSCYRQSTSELTQLFWLVYRRLLTIFLGFKKFSGLFFFLFTSGQGAACFYRCADKSLVRPGRKESRKYVRDERDFNNIETRAVVKFFFLQGKAPKEIHAILTETLACFLPGRAKDLSAPLYIGLNLTQSSLLKGTW